MARRHETAALILMGTLLAGCVETAPAAVTTFARADCAAGPDLAAPISLTPSQPQTPFTVTKPLDATSPCLSRPAGRSPYQLFRLPKDADAKTLMVGSRLERARLVPPEVSILDKAGAVTRTFTRPDYFFRGAVYSVLFRPRPGDAYILVAVDPARVGERYDSIAIGTSTSTTATAHAAASWTFGLDKQESRTFSYEGAVQVIVYDDIKDKPH